MKIIFQAGFTAGLLFNLLSCTTQNEGPEIASTLRDSAVPAVITQAKAPSRVAIDTMPPPAQVGFAKRFNPDRIGSPAEFNRLFINYTVEDGLPVNGYTSSLIDSEGNIWFGSNGAGAVRYDGQHFDQFSTANGISNNGIWQMMNGPDGYIYFATYGGGLVEYNGRSFSALTKENGLPSNGIYSMCKDREGAIWLGTVENGACYLRNDSIFKIDSETGFDANSVHHVTALKDGSVWLGTEKGIYKYASGIAVLQDAKHGLPTGDQTCLLADDDLLWVGTTNSGLYVSDGNIFHKYEPPQGFSLNNITALYRDQTGTLWVANALGLARITSREFSILGSDQGFPKSTVTSIIADVHGKIWITTEDNGLFLYKGDAYQQLDKQKHLSGSSVYTMCEDLSGRVWMGTAGSGVFCLENGRMKRFTVKDGLAADQLWSMAADKAGNVWIGSIRNGVTRFDGTSFTTLTTRQGLSSDMVRFIWPSSKGDIWFATTGGGVNRLVNGIIERYTTEQGLPSDVILCILEDRTGSWWFGTVGKGVCKFDGKTFKTYDTTSGLENNIVTTLLEDRSGNLWIGTEGGGITRYDGRSMMTISTSNGLPDNTVYGISEDTSGYIWIGTNKGVLKLQFEGPANLRPVSGTALSNAELKKHRIVSEEYSRKTGYPFGDMTSGQNSLLIDHTGIIWAGTGDNRYGIVRIGQKYHAPESMAAPLFRSVALNEKPVAWYPLKSASSSGEILNEEVITFGHRLEDAARGQNLRQLQGVSFTSIDRRYPVPIGLKLPYRFNTVSISFGTILPGMRELTEYRYRLDGHSADWSPPTYRTDVSFGNLREGSYRFQVCSRYDRGPWSPESTYAFIVLPPWYRTWYMYAVYVILLAATILGYSRWRTRRLLAANKELEQKVVARTAEVVREKENVEREKKKSDDLLLNILPAATAEELKSNGRATPKKYENVTVLFTDFKNFTQACERMSPAEMVEEINYCYTMFDRIISKHSLEKIKTIGDSYMCAGGLPVERADHAEACVAAALEIRDFMLREKARRLQSGQPYFDVRIGLHSGPVVAGIVGEKKFAYDIWGDTVNIASRMESNGAIGEVNVSASTQQLIRARFACTPRGALEVKNKGSMEMYFVKNATKG